MHISNQFQPLAHHARAMKRSVSAIDEWRFGPPYDYQCGRAFLLTYEWQDGLVPLVLQRVLEKAASITEANLKLSRCVTLTFKGIRDASGSLLEAAP